MLSRITLLLITGFWLCMNFLLWRSEYGSRDQVGASVPAALVWQKILTAPDKSTLDIFHHGKKIGDCGWSAYAGQGLTAGKILTDGLPLDAPVQKPTGYHVYLTANFTVPGSPIREGFSADVIFTTDRVWKEFDASLSLRPDKWRIHSRASEQTLRLRMEGEDEKSVRIYKFSDLQSPQFLVQEFQLPIPRQLLDALGLNQTRQPAAPLAPGLYWEAHADRFTIAHASVRAYRLETHLFDRYRIIVTVSEVGEILRVELPDEWVLVNNGFSDL
jgi:hypothetical protein